MIVSEKKIVTSRGMNVSGGDQEELQELLHILDTAGITAGGDGGVGGDNVSMDNMTGLIEDILDIAEQERYKLTINLRIIFLAGIFNILSAFICTCTCTFGT